MSVCKKCGVATEGSQLCDDCYGKDVLRLAKLGAFHHKVMVELQIDFNNKEGASKFWEYVTPRYLHRINAKSCLPWENGTKLVTEPSTWFGIENIIDWADILSAASRFGGTADSPKDGAELGLFFSIDRSAMPESQWVVLPTILNYWRTPFVMACKGNHNRCKYEDDEGLDAYKDALYTHFVCESEVYDAVHFDEDWVKLRIFKSTLNPGEFEMFTKVAVALFAFTSLCDVKITDPNKLYEKFFRYTLFSQRDVFKYFNACGSNDPQYDHQAHHLKW